MIEEVNILIHVATKWWTQLVSNNALMKSQLLQQKVHPRDAKTNKTFIGCSN